MKKMYEFDPETKEFLGISDATPNPLSPGEYFERMYATFDEPPTIKENEKAVWNEKTKKWEVQLDFRGTTYYFRNKEGQIDSATIKKLNEKVPENGYLNIDDIPKTKEEKEYTVRYERDKLLQEVVDNALRDFTYAGQFPSQELVNYRQALRDIPKQSGFPDNVVWPQKPKSF